MNLSVINGNNEPAEIKPSCTVKLDNEAQKFDEFVVVGIDPNNGKVGILRYADALMLGMAMKMITDAFHKEMLELDDDTQQKIMGVLTA
jgi:hypothetical protein